MRQKLASGKRGDKPEYPIYPDMAPGGQLGDEYKQRRGAVGEEMYR